MFWDLEKEQAICKKCSSGSRNEQVRRRYFYPKEMPCGICGAVMMFDKTKKFYWCSDCGNETWPYTNEPRDENAIREEFEKNLPCDRNQYKSAGVIHVKSKAASGSKSKAKAKKQPEKKKTTAQIYKELASSCNAADRGNRHDTILKKINT